MAAESSAIINTPENQNFLSPLNFRFQIKRAPHVNFFIQRVNLPAMRLPGVQYPNPIQNIPYYGEHMEFADLNIEFIVDEDLNNYLEIHNWMNALGTPNNLEEFRSISEQQQFTGNGIFSDISLFILSSAKNPNFEVIYRDCYPSSLTELEFDTSDESIKYLTCIATFKYTSYKIEQL